MLDIQATWQLDWDNIPLDPIGTQGPTNIGNFIADKSDNKLSLAPPVVGNMAFTFFKATFIAEITGLPPTVDPVTGRTAFANAWRDAMMASIPIVPSGTYIGTPTPPTTFSAPPSATPVVAAGYSALLADLLSAPLATGTYAASLVNPMLVPSQFPISLRNAFLMVQYILTGIDSTPPPLGPLPLSTTASVL